MARQFGWALAALILVSGSAVATSATQGPAKQQKSGQRAEGRRDGHDRTPWWKSPKTVAELGLTAEQSSTIDGIFKEYIDAARPLRGQLDQLEKALDRTMKANVAEVAVVAEQVDRIETRRAELNKMRTVALYRIRRVLNAEQNTKFQAMLDRRDAARRRHDGDRRR